MTQTYRTPPRLDPVRRVAVALHRDATNHIRPRVQFAGLPVEMQDEWLRRAQVIMRALRGAR